MICEARFSYERRALLHPFLRRDESSASASAPDPFARPRVDTLLPRSTPFCHNCYNISLSRPSTLG